MPSFDTHYATRHGFRPLEVTGQKAKDHKVRQRNKAGTGVIERDVAARPLGFVAIDGVVGAFYTREDAEKWLATDRKLTDDELRADPTILYTEDQILDFGKDIAAMMAANDGMTAADAAAAILRGGIIRRTGSERATSAGTPKGDPMARLLALLAPSLPTVSGEAAGTTQTPAPEEGDTETGKAPEPTA